MAEGGKTIQFGGMLLDILDPHSIEPTSADLIVEHRVFASGVVCLSFAAVVTDGNGKPEARVTSRVRLPLAVGKILKDLLTEILDAEMPGKEKAN